MRSDHFQYKLSLNILIFSVLITNCEGSFENDVIPEDDGRIVGGVEALIEDFPYQVLVKSYLDDVTIERCGGSIITEKIILSAAHCYYKSEIFTYSVIAGSTNIAIHSKPSIPVIAIVYSKKFVRKTFNFDVALLVLKYPLEFSDKIQPIDLNKANNPMPEGTYAIVSGWGDTEKTLKGTDVLMSTVVRIMNHEECKKHYVGINEITKYMFCAGTEDGGQDACHGDSGGPLTTEYYQIGITSFGIGCGESQFPGVYTDVSTVRSWIDKAIEHIDGMGPIEPRGDGRAHYIIL